MDAAAVSEIVGTITGVIATVSAIGVAVISVVVALKTFSWARSALR